MSLGRELSGVQVNSDPVAPARLCVSFVSREKRLLKAWSSDLQVRVETVFRLPEGPLLRRMLTGPVAPVQVSLKGLPSWTLKSVLVNEALAATRAANRAGAMKNCILTVCVWWLFVVDLVDRESVEKMEEASGCRMSTTGSGLTKAEDEVEESTEGRVYGMGGVRAG